MQISEITKENNYLFIDNNDISFLTMTIHTKTFEEHSDYEAFLRSGKMILPNISYCKDNNEVHYNPIITESDPFNGHNYVDFGLPSGTLWATNNIGAVHDYDTGLYFAWGETTGYTSSQVGTDKNFEWSDYRLGNGGSTSSDMLKYNSTDNKQYLELADDAARVVMGGAWHMPTVEQYNELLQATANHRVSTSNRTGRYFVSLTDESKAIFIPETGYADGRIIGVGSMGILWTNEVYDIDKKDANVLYCSGGGVSLNNGDRAIGLNVRGVIKPFVAEINGFTRPFFYNTQERNAFWGKDGNTGFFNFKLDFPIKANSGILEIYDYTDYEVNPRKFGQVDLITNNNLIWFAEINNVSFFDTYYRLIFKITLTTDNGNVTIVEYIRENVSA